MGKIKTVHATYNKGPVRTTGDCPHQLGHEDAPHLYHSVCVIYITYKVTCCIVVVFLYVVQMQGQAFGSYCAFFPKFNPCRGRESNRQSAKLDGFAHAQFFFAHALTARPPAEMGSQSVKTGGNLGLIS